MASLEINEHDSIDDYDMVQLLYNICDECAFQSVYNKEIKKYQYLRRSKADKSLECTKCKDGKVLSAFGREIIKIIAENK